MIVFYPVLLKRRFLGAYGALSSAYCLRTARSKLRKAEPLTPNART